MEQYGWLVWSEDETISDCMYTTHTQAIAHTNIHTHIRISSLIKKKSCFFSTTSVPIHLFSQPNQITSFKSFFCLPKQSLHNTISETHTHVASFYNKHNLPLPTCPEGPQAVEDGCVLGMVSERAGRSGGDLYKS